MKENSDKDVSPNPAASKDRIYDALITFSDFIYAIVFVAIVQQMFDNLLNDEDKIKKNWPTLLLLIAIFYFLTWDWILGRILTLRNPYKGYTAFFCEVMIAAFAYGVASAAISGKISFILYFAFMLLLGTIWAKRMEKNLKESRDSQELCMIRSLQCIAAVICLIFLVWWHFYVSDTVSGKLITISVIGGWALILVYEMLVPRPPGVMAGPGVPFVVRSDVRKIRRFLRNL